jgi:Flp pilus assembly protein TadD
MTLTGRAIFLLVAFLLSTGLSSAQTVSNSQPSTSPTASPDSVQAPAAASEFDVPRHLIQQGKYEDALAVLHNLETSHPAMRGLAHEFGVAYYQKSDFMNAISYLKKAQEENRDDREAIQLLGISYYLAGRPAEAIPLLENVQTWFPTANVDAAYILGICYIQTKDYAHARAAFAQMFGVSSESAASYLFTARMLLRQDFGPVAEEYAKKAAALDPKLPLSHFLLGELNLYHTKIPEAIAEFQKELELNPGNAATYYKLAETYTRIQKYDEAEKLLQRSIWLDATATGPYILMGKVLEKKGDSELAVRALQHALAMDPNNPLPHHLLGQAYRDMGRSEDAERELRVAGQLEERQNTKP